MMLVGIPRITQDEDTFRISVSLETIIADVLCDVSRAIVAGEDDAAFNALDDLGMTMEAIEIGDTETHSMEALASQLHDRIKVALEELGLKTELTMGPFTARQLGERLLAFADNAKVSA